VRRLSVLLRLASAAKKPSVQPQIDALIEMQEASRARLQK